MATTKTARRRPPKADTPSAPVGEDQLFRGMLERTGQVQKDAPELKPGVTHVLVDAPTGEVLVRRRFSAV